MNESLEQNTNQELRSKRLTISVFATGVVGFAIPIVIPAVFLLIQFWFFPYHPLDMKADWERSPKLNFIPSIACGVVFSLAALVSAQTAKRKRTTFTQALILLGLTAITSFLLSSIICYGVFMPVHRKVIDPLGPLHSCLFLFLLVAIPSCVAAIKIHMSK